MNLLYILTIAICIIPIIYYRANYSSLKILMKKRNENFRGSINNINNIFQIIRVLRKKDNLNRSDSFFLKTMLFSYLLPLFILLIFTILLYIFPDILFND